jgi:hypothetical protein
MKTINPRSIIQVAVYETTLPALIALKQSSDESLADVIQRVADASRPGDNKLVFQAGQAKKKASKAHYKHRILFLDVIIGANSLGELFGKLIDVLFDIAPESLEKLARMKARTRRYVARDRNNIHPASPHLPTLKTKSGWYVSKNVGTDDFIRGVRALCRASDLKHGEDVLLQG